MLGAAGARRRRLWRSWPLWVGAEQYSPTGVKCRLSRKPTYRVLLAFSLMGPLASPAPRLSRGGRMWPLLRKTTVVGVCAFASISWQYSLLGSLRFGARYFWMGHGC
jgi:hypothetical protein